MSYLYTHRKRYFLAHMLGIFLVFIFTLQFVNVRATSTAYNASSSLAQAGFGLALDSVHHRLFIADGSNSRVIVHNLDSNNELIDSTPDNVLGQPDFSTTTPTTSQSGMNAPFGLAYDATNDRLFVSEVQNHRILTFDVRPGPASPIDICGTTTTGLADGMNASCYFGQIDFGFAILGTDNMAMAFPGGVTYDDDNKLIYVADHDNNRVVSFDVDPATIANGETMHNVLGQVDFNGTTSGNSLSAMSGPNGVKYYAGMLFVADMGNHRVLVFDARPSGSGATSICGTSTTGIADGMNASCSIAQTNFDIAIDTDSNSYLISSTNRVLRFDLSTLVNNQTPNAVFGQPNFILTNNGIGLDGLSNPIGIQFYNRTMYVADSGNLRVLFYKFIIFDPAVVTSLSGTEGVSFAESPATLYDQGTVTYSLVSGSLPPGITLGSDLSGTLTTAGTYNFTLQAIDTTDVGVFTSDSVAFSMIVAAAPPGTSGSSGSSGSSTTGSSTTSGSSGGVIIIPPSTTTTGTTGTGTTTTGTTTTGTGTTDTTTSGTSTTGTTTDTGSTTSGSTTSGSATSGSSTGGTTGGSLGGGSGSIPPATVCADGVDNDGDRKIDLFDPGCTSPSDNDEFNLPADPCLINPASCLPPPEDYCDPGLFSTIVCIVKDSITLTEGTYLSTTGAIKGIILDDSNDGLVKIIGIVGIIFGGLFTLLPALFANPLSFSELFLIPARLWSLLLTAFGLKKRHRPWGRVYDSVTKQPLDPVYVSLQDVDGKEITSCITDLDGRYGFLVEPGKYRIVPKKTHYSFPSLKLIGKTRDEVYLDLYFGYVFEIKKQGEVIAKNIPMDPDTFDWNEFAKQDQKLMHFYSKYDRTFARVADITFSVGFTISSIAVLVAPTGYNMIIFFLYLCMLVLRESGFRQKSSGGVMRAGTDIPIPFSLVRIFSVKTDVEIASKVANKLGKYYALVGNGEYYVKIETKEADGSYKLAYTSGPIKVTDGILKEVFSVGAQTAPARKRSLRSK